eukprot:COSAG01_NODE_2256_length_8067_cov_5.797691_2_plen_133_part_00
MVSIYTQAPMVLFLPSDGKRCVMDLKMRSCCLRLRQRGWISCPLSDALFKPQLNETWHQRLWRQHGGKWSASFLKTGVAKQKSLKLVCRMLSNVLFNTLRYNILFITLQCECEPGNCGYLSLGRIVLKLSGV